MMGPFTMRSLNSPWCKSAVAPRRARRLARILLGRGTPAESALADKARRPRIPPVFDGGATQTARMHRASNAGGLAPRAVKLLLFVMLLGGSALAQSPTYGVGRTPSAEEIRSWDISISPTGEELPPGRGTAEEGALVYQQQGCAVCHGAEGTEGQAPRLVKLDVEPNADPWDLGRILPIRAPYSTGVWDYINRAMPMYREETLTADEVYALTAFLLFKNDLISETEVLDAQSLPKIEMPNRNGWAPMPEDWQPGMPRLQGYPY